MKATAGGPTIRAELEGNVSHWKETHSSVSATVERQTPTTHGSPGGHSKCWMKFPGEEDLQDKVLQLGFFSLPAELMSCWIEDTRPDDVL